MNYLFKGNPLYLCGRNQKWRVISGKIAINSLEAHGMENARSTLRRVAEQLISIANEGGWIKIYVNDRSSSVTKAESNTNFAILKNNKDLKGTDVSSL